jgi:hypothetical protein
MDKLAGNHTKILAFDCEFWRVSGTTKTVKHIPKTNEFFVPREIGGFVFEKNENEWIYCGDFILTFSNPKGLSASFVSSGFSGVSASTKKKLDHIQNEIQNKGLNLAKESVSIYNKDPIVKSAHKPPSFYKTFMKLYEESLIVVKGTQDIDALKNACTLYNIDYTEPKGVYDIAEWNPEAHKKCGTAKLEGVYKCLKTELKEFKSFEKMLPVGKAHDPRSDAAMTFLIALKIISTSN